MWVCDKKVEKFEFTNERLTYFTELTIQQQSVSPKTFTKKSLFTIQRLLFGDSTVILNTTSKKLRSPYACCYFWAEYKYGLRALSRVPRAENSGYYSEIKL